MNWYAHFFEQAEIGDRVFGGLDKHFTEKELLIALVIAQSKSGATKEDLQDLIKAYKDYRKGVRYYEQSIRTVSAI